MRAKTAIAVLLVLLGTPIASAAQAPAPAPAEVDPIRCWWQSSAGAITIGEAFSVSLTCAVLDTESVQVVADESRLGVATAQFTPFEIVGGDHPPDSRAGTRRFFQYHYSLRTLDRDMIGHDVKIPQLNLSYRVHSRVGADAALEGRDLTYILPAISLRVLSLVPAEAPDIRDGGDASLGAVDALRFRAGLFEILAGMFALLAVIAATLALMPMARGAKQASAPDRGRLSDRLVLNRVAAELTDIHSVTAHDGWSEPLVVRALSALRLVAAASIGGAVSQKTVVAGEAAPEGRLLVQRGWPNAMQVAVSSSVTPDDIERAIARLPVSATVTSRQELVDLHEGLRAFTAAVYPKTPARDVVSLDAALKHGLAMSHQLARR